MTRENKHTPGPWFAIYNGHYWDVNVENRRNAQSVASVHDNEYIEGKAEDRARIIAAAPDLLEALSSILQPLELGGGTCRIREGNQKIIAARAAIAKARGQQ